jgi:hypothetical protein
LVIEEKYYLVWKEMVHLGIQYVDVLLFLNEERLGKVYDE